MRLEVTGRPRSEELCVGAILRHLKRLWCALTLKISEAVKASAWCSFATTVLSVVCFHACHSERNGVTQLCIRMKETLSFYIISKSQSPTTLSHNSKPLRKKIFSSKLASPSQRDLKGLSSFSHSRETGLFTSCPLSYYFFLKFIYPRFRSFCPSMPSPLPSLLPLGTKPR